MDTFMSHVHVKRQIVKMLVARLPLCTFRKYFTAILSSNA